MVLNADKTFDLRSISVEGGDWEMGEYMEPSTDYIKKFEFGSTAIEGRYTYVSEGFLKFNFCDYDDQWKEYEWAIGWWNWEKGLDFWEIIGDGDPDKRQIKEPVMVTIGQCFLGSLSDLNLRFVSNGQVVQDTTAYDTKGNQAAYFLNYLPVEIDLNDIEVEGGDWEMGEYMEPSTDYIKKFEFGSTAIEGRYTYVSEGFLKFNFCDYDDQWKEYEWAIGWWNWEKGLDFWEVIGAGDEDKRQIKVATPVPAGQGFLGSLSDLELQFKFPNPTNLPKREQK